MCQKVTSSQLCVESIFLVTAAFAHDATKTCCLSMTAAKPHQSSNLNILIATILLEYLYPVLLAEAQTTPCSASVHQNVAKSLLFPLGVTVTHALIAGLRCCT